MFNEIKHSYGVADAWEQTSQNLHRWVSMLSVAYALTRMLSVLASAQKNRSFIPLVQWRVNRPVTAGLIQMGLQLFFRQFSFVQLWEPKSKKFVSSNELKLKPAKTSTRFVMRVMTFVIHAELLQRAFLIYAIVPVGKFASRPSSQ